MTQPVTPLDNKDAIAQMGQELRATISLLITEFIRPNAQAIAQTSANLDRVEAVARQADEVSSENEQRFETLLAEARADRAKAEQDRAQWQANFDAQQEVLQRLLLEIRSTNGEVKQLGDRVTNLEAS